MAKNDLPESYHIYNLYNGAYKSHSIRVALVLDIFHPWQPDETWPHLFSKSVIGGKQCLAA